ncbi:hypothetical protein NMQ03_07935 [Arthrobacter sp. DNA4]|uniref:hypothetical protein n=1 Tax=Arthrobacter sp. DNA4 TaxID=2963432 RepID=UPI0020CF38E9|nr:hypothetical protein [Arthrobacter sp. DNA4]UTT71019.1 hypothetical protein NMQ03_07935 [Arthrobacter sp. DNA4]
MPYNRTEEQWEQLIDAAMANLTAVAEQRSQKSYSKLNAELADETGQPAFNFRNPGDLAGMSRLLANVGERGLIAHPDFLITSLVTGKHSGEPGLGFYSLGESAGLLQPGGDKEQFWVEQTNAAHAYYSPKRNVR